MVFSSFALGSPLRLHVSAAVGSDDNTGTPERLEHEAREAVRRLREARTHAKGTHTPPC